MCSDTRWRKEQLYALVAAVVDMAVVAGALVVSGAAVVAASRPGKHQ